MTPAAGGRQPRIAPTVALLMAGVLLAGCDGTPPEPEPVAATAPRPARSQSVPAPSSAAHGAAEHDHAGHTDDELPSAPEPFPTWDHVSAQAAAMAAEQALTAYAADLDAVAWWQSFAPHLSSTARVAYEATDPTSVPVGNVGRTVAIPARTSTPYLVDLEVSTDVGVYVVRLSRSGADSSWLVERLSPAPGSGS